MHQFDNCKFIIDKFIILCYNVIENEERKKLNKTIKFKNKGENVMRIEILQEFKGIIGEIEFERENIYDVVEQFLTETDMEEKLEKLKKEEVNSFVGNLKEVFNMAEHCGLDVYNVLDNLRNDVDEEKEVLGESLEGFYWMNRRLTQTKEFKEMNKVYKKTLDIELY